MKVYRHINVTTKWFLDYISYRFEYSAFTSKRYINEEGESIIYNIPHGINFLKIGKNYYNLGKLDEKTHTTKAKAILELKKRRKQKYYLKKEGKPTWDNSYKNPPKNKR